MGGMKYVVGMVTGAVLGPLLMVLAAGILGGYARAAPCHLAPDFISGAMFGASMAIDVWPYAAIIGGLLGTIPARWIKWRFSLRMLLIATTLVALALGLIVWATSSVELHTLGGPSRIVNEHGRLIEK
jgi:hypothetical protein